jgi:hypothetical protein
LNIDFGIKNESKDSKIVIVSGEVVREGRGNEDDEGEGILLMSCMYIHRISNEVSSSCFKWGRKGVVGRKTLGAISPKYNARLLGVGTMNPPCTMNLH